MTRLPPPPPVLPLDYATPAGRPLWAHWLIHMSIWHGAMQVVFFSALFVVPRFEQVFKDFKVELPGITGVVLLCSRVLRTIHGVAIAIALPTAIASSIALIGVEDREQDRRWRLTLSRWLAFAMAGAIVVTVILAILWPYSVLMDAVTIGTKKGR